MFQIARLVFITLLLVAFAGVSGCSKEPQEMTCEELKEAKSDCWDEHQIKGQAVLDMVCEPLYELHRKKCE